MPLAPLPQPPTHRAGPTRRPSTASHGARGLVSSGAAVTSCWTATTKLPPPGWERLLCRRSMRGGEWEVEDAGVATCTSQPNQKKSYTG
jgi:hypothetical protein